MWPEPIRNRDKKALRDLRKELSDSIARERFLQFIFFEQWNDLKSHCDTKGVRLFGDIPFYVGHDSADVWANSRYLQTGRRRHPRICGRSAARLLQ